MSWYEIVGDTLIILVFVSMAVSLPDIEDDD